MNLSKFLFSITDKDCHYVISVLGIKIKFKHGYKYVCPVVKTSGITDKKRSPEVIVSLTSFPARINSVEKTIRTLLTQTLKPDRVILWLAEEQFHNKENDLPRQLLALKNFGLDIDSNFTSISDVVSELLAIDHFLFTRDSEKLLTKFSF